MASVDITDPDVWNKMGKGVRRSTIETMSALLTKAALKAGKAEELLSMREQGVDLSTQVLLVVDKSNPLVPERVRNEMAATDKYWSRIYPVSDPLPNGSELFYRKNSLIARTKMTGDLWGMICLEDQVFAFYVSLEDYLREEEEDRIAAEEKAKVAAAEAEQELLHEAERVRAGLAPGRLSVEAAIEEEAIESAAEEAAIERSIDDQEEAAVEASIEQEAIQAQIDAATPAV